MAVELAKTHEELKGHRPDGGTEFRLKFIQRSAPRGNCQYQLWETTYFPNERTNDGGE
jgi:hypothetical protein